MTSKLTTDSPERSQTLPSDSVNAVRVTQFNWQFWLGLLISLVSLYLSLRGVQISSLANAFQNISAGWLLLSLLVSVLTLVVKAARWRVLFKPHTLPTPKRALSIQSIGMLLNTFAPARLGDLARAYLMGEAQKENKIFVLGTIVVEKVLDLSFIIISVAVLFTRMALPGWLVEPAEATAILLVIFLPVFFLLAWKQRFFVGLFERLAHLAPEAWRGWLIRQAERGLASLSVLTSPRILLELMFWSALVWALGFVTNLFVFWALGLSITPWAGVFLLAVLQVGVAVPSSPGRIGVFHYLTILSLGVFGIARELGLGVGVVLHLIVYVPLTLLGAWFLWREKITWAKLSEAAARLKQITAKNGGEK